MSDAAEGLCFAREQTAFESFLNWLKRKFEKPRVCNSVLHARREFKAIGYIPPEEDTEDGPNKWIQENILELLAVFAKQGHSGMSAPYCIDMFAKLAKFEPLGPITGVAEEWVEYADGIFQNNRCSHVFKDSADGRPYDSNGKIFQEPSGCCYTGRESRVFIEFPYTPKREYVLRDFDKNEISKEQYDVLAEQYEKEHANDV